jgi:hypothetical protein
MLPYEKGRWLPFDLLADIGPDLDPGSAATTNALGLAKAMMDFPTGQIVGQFAAAMRRFRPSRT